MLENLTEQLRQSKSLDATQITAAVAQLIDENISAETKADFLAALSQKGETVEELAAFARELREKSVQPNLDAETRSREILDVCGTGGDRLNTFNISTTVALLVASAGVAVAKHGNRAVTSQSGSADVLEALGIKIDLSAEQAAESLRQHNFAFFFAPKFHPAFKHLGLARKRCAQRGQRTIFNLLGPLLNPARPTAQLIGVPNPKFCEPMAKVLQMLGVRRGMVVSGQVSSLKFEVQSSAAAETSNIQHPTSNAESGASENSALRVPHSALFLDEFSTLGETFLAEFYQERGFSCSTIAPENFPLQPTSLEHLAGSDSKANAEIVRRIFSREERGAKRDAVLLNSAAALLVAGKVKNLSEGWELGEQLIQTGTAQKKLADLIQVSAAY